MERRYRITESGIKTLVMESVTRLLSEGWSDDNGPIATNSPEDGDSEYRIDLWPGSGYSLDSFRVYGFDAQDAVNKLVAWLDNQDNWTYFDDDEVYGGIARVQEQGGDVDDYIDSLSCLYVDATMEGASRPHYLRMDNAHIEEQGGE